jgi:hypothetical protein
MVQVGRTGAPRALPELHPLSCGVERGPWGSKRLRRAPGDGAFFLLFGVPARLFAEAFTSQCLLDAELLPRLQVERVSLDFLDDVFLQNFPFKSAERVLQRLAFLKPYFSQIYVSAFRTCDFVARTSLRGERPNIQWGAKNSCGHAKPLVSGHGFKPCRRMAEQFGLQPLPQHAQRLKPSVPMR